jgi:hypothetical protein
MPKAQLAAFIKTVAERPVLNRRVAAVPRTPAAWIEVAKSVGVEVSVQEFVDFVTEITGKPADANNAVRVLLGQSEGLPDAALEQVTGGAQGTASLAFSSSIGAALSKTYIIPCI